LKLTGQQSAIFRRPKPYTDAMLTQTKGRTGIESNYLHDQEALLPKMKHDISCEKKEGTPNVHQKT